MRALVLVVALLLAGAGCLSTTGAPAPAKSQENATATHDGTNTVLGPPIPPLGTAWWQDHLNEGSRQADADRQGTDQGRSGSGDPADRSENSTERQDDRGGARGGGAATGSNAEPTPQGEEDSGPGGLRVLPDNGGDDGGDRPGPGPDPASRGGLPPLLDL